MLRLEFMCIMYSICWNRLLCTVFQYFFYYFADVFVSVFCVARNFLYVCVQALVVLFACVQSSLCLLFILLVGLVF